MKTVVGLLSILVTLAADGVAVQAQQPKKISRIGYFSVTDATTDSARSNPFRQALRELGYTEGQNIAIEYRYAEGKPDREAALAAEFVRLKVDIIVVAGGDPLIRAAMNATKRIPIVLTGQGSDPVKAGFIESLARPGGNVTGITGLSTELGGKRLELLKEAVPKVARVAVLYDPDSPGFAREAREDLPVAARALGLIIRPFEARDADGLEKALAALEKDHPDGLYATSGGALMRANVKRIGDFALKSRLPSLYTGREGVVDAGWLLYYGVDLVNIYRRAAIYVDKILKGAKPAELPVERPTKFELIINLKAAKQIGATIPPNVLARADRVIK
jgi:putative ABC transport system substrate-binding protein